MTTPTTPPLAEEPDDAVPGSSGNGLRDVLNDRKPLVIIGAAALALVLVAFFVVVPALSSNSSKSTTTSTPVVVTHTSVAVSPSKSAARKVVPATAAAAPAALTVRDPFSPLINPSEAVGGGASASTSASPSAAPISSSAAPTIIVVAPSSSAPTTDKVTLVAVNVVAKDATVTVNGVTHVVLVGYNFPDPWYGPFEVTTVATGTASFLDGEAGFSLKVGQSRTFTV